ncbi:hypothetical protein BJV78DRAFT_1354635 [Lactifluus subvellereus]|nr:hypothetical protein BJV78DRAFT_1354635 [Lactifluus subvellereus]
MSQTPSLPFTSPIPTSDSSLQASRTLNSTYRSTPNAHHLATPLTPPPGPAEGYGNTMASCLDPSTTPAEPHVAVNNNDCTVKLFDVNVRGAKGIDGPPKRISEVGTLRLDVPVNYSSIPPEGCTLLSVGDSPQVYLHGMAGGARITFNPLAQLTFRPSPHPQACTRYMALAHSLRHSAPRPPPPAQSLPSHLRRAWSRCGILYYGPHSPAPRRDWWNGEDRDQGDGYSQRLAVRGFVGLDNTRKQSARLGSKNVKFSSGICGKEIMAFTESFSPRSPSALSPSSPPPNPQPQPYGIPTATASVRERDRERRLRVRVRQIRDVLLTTAPSASVSGSGNISVSAPVAAAPVLPRRRPHEGAGAEMDVDLDTDDAGEIEAEAFPDAF